MAGFISFEENTPEITWSSANWVFRGFLDCVIAIVPADSKVIYELTVSKHHQNVDLGNLAKENPEVYSRVITAFIRACDQITSGKGAVSVEGRELDDVSQRQYKEAISELTEILKPYSNL